MPFPYYQNNNNNLNYERHYENVATRTVIVEKWPEKSTINLNIQSIPVQVQTRRIRATWNPELAQEISVLQSFSVIQELEKELIKSIGLIGNKNSDF